MRRALTSLAVCLALTATSCTGSEGQPPAPEPVEVAWEYVDLPQPPGPTGRVAVRDAVSCDGTWWLVGGVFGADGESFPAGWRSDDAGLTWSTLRFTPRGYWAERAVLASVACQGERVVMVGAKSGGAHGNPRVATWYQAADGRFLDVVAPFSLYGGDQAVSVGRVVAGPGGWLIAGNRTAGAAVWVASNDQDFELIDDDPALIRDAQLDTLAIDQVHDGTEWTVVGAGHVEGRVNGVPLAWVSPDGRRWTRQQVPTTDAYADLERVVATDDGLLALGLRGEAFGTWRRIDGRWRATEDFGAADPDGLAFRGISGLVTDGDDALAAVADGTSYSLWATLGGDPWAPVEVPVSPEAAGEQVLTVAAADGTVLLLADDAQKGRMWRAAWPQ